MVLLMCLKIFAARIVDVSLGTLRTVLVVKGKTLEPVVIAFIEVLVWFAVAKEALTASGNGILIAISYAGGYATGTFIGTKLTRFFIKGTAGVQIILKEDSEKLVNKLRKKGYAVSVIELKNDYEGKHKDMLYIQVDNKKIKELTNMVESFDNNAFIVVNETKLIHNGFVK